MNYMYLPPAYKSLKRGPQVMLPKDIGLVISYSGIGKESICVDAGTGSGWLAIALSRVSKSVTSYETREEFIKIAQRNADRLGVMNLKIINADISKGIGEKDVDLISLDMPNSDKIIKYANKALKDGGCIFGYLPHMEQVKKFIKALNRYKFRDTITIEAIVRDMLVREEGMRPSTKGVFALLITFITGVLQYSHTFPVGSIFAF